MCDRYRAISISSSGLVLKSHADMIARSISLLGRPASSSAMPSDSYIHGCGWPFGQRGLNQRDRVIVLLLLDELLHRAANDCEVLRLLGEVLRPERLGRLRQIDLDAGHARGRLRWPSFRRPVRAGAAAGVGRSGLRDARPLAGLGSFGSRRRRARRT